MKSFIITTSHRYFIVKGIFFFFFLTLIVGALLIWFSFFLLWIVSVGALMLLASFYFFVIRGASQALIFEIDGVIFLTSQNINSVQEIIPYQDISKIRFEQKGILAHFFGYGDIIFQTKENERVFLYAPDVENTCKKCFDFIQNKKA